LSFTSLTAWPCSGRCPPQPNLLRGNLAAFKPLLGIPGSFDVLGIVAFGYAVKTIGKGRKKRKPLSEVSYRERFDQPYE